MTTRKNLLSKVFFCLALSAAAFAVTASASAQSQARVTIPFGFTADNVTFPAGSYTVSTNPVFPSLVYLSDVKTGETKMLMVRPDSGLGKTGPSRLTFRRQPGGIYLSQVWISGTGTYRELTSHPKADPEVARLSQETSVFDIANK